MPTPLLLISSLMCDHSVCSPLLNLLPHQQVQIADHGRRGSGVSELAELSHRFFLQLGLLAQ
jgi:hypothetical protein